MSTILGTHRISKHLFTPFQAHRVDIRHPRVFKHSLPVVMGLQGKYWVRVGDLSTHFSPFGLTGNIVGTHGEFQHLFPPLKSYRVHIRRV